MAETEAEGGKVSLVARRHRISEMDLEKVLSMVLDELTKGSGGAVAAEYEAIIKDMFDAICRVTDPTGARGRKVN